MTKRPAKKKLAKDHRHLTRKVLDAVVPDAEPAAKKPTRKPSRPKNKQGAAGEGMAQPRDKNPAARR